MTTLDTVQHKPLKEEIFEALHKQIIAGKYLPGDWLRQEEIANQMGVSMTPVREGLDLLVAAGLAERVHYRGVRVPEMSPNDIVEAYGLRLVLEAVAAQGAAMLITREQVSALSRTQDELKNQVTLNEMSHARQLSREFHRNIVAAAGNNLLSKLYDIVANAFPDWMLYEAMFHHPECLTESLADDDREHRAILDALGQGKPDAASQKAVDHVLHLGTSLEELLDIPSELLREKERQVLPLIKQSK
ncbi:MAG: GntR family transcriptional regulator [Anaerolineales bacterium]|nr:GntR family transcriptional regulator [Anaerolineales bacterium]